MKKTLLLLLLTANFLSVYACSCAQTSLQDKFRSNDFIAFAKILEVTPDEKNKEYHNLEIKIIKLFKGEEIKKIKIHSFLNSSCAFYADKNSTWLIFANHYNGELQFGYCSGAVQQDRKFDLIKFPKAETKHKQSLDMKLSILNWIKENKISFKNQYDVKFGIPTDSLQTLKNFDGNKRDFAVVEYEITKDIKLRKTSLLRGFNNNKLSAKLLKQLKSQVKFSHKTLKELPQKTKLYEIYYFYPEETYESFVTTYDL